MDAINKLYMQLIISALKPNQPLPVTQITVKSLVKLLDASLI